MRGLLQRTSQPVDAQSPGDPARSTAPAPAPSASDPSSGASRPPTRSERGRLRRRLAELRELHDEQLLDLGGFVFDLYRFGRQRDDVVRSKLNELIASDRERREIERRLDEQRAARELPHRSVGSCPHCATLHTSDSRFCRQCGSPLGSEAARTPSAPAPEAPAPLAEAAVEAAPAPPPAATAEEQVDHAPPLPPPLEEGQPEPPTPMGEEPDAAAAPPVASSPSEWLPPALEAQRRPAPEPAAPPAPEPASSWHPPPAASTAPDDAGEADRPPAPSDGGDAAR